MRTKARSPPTKQDYRRPDGEEGALGHPAGRGVGGRAVTGADPDGGDDKERHAEHRDHEAEPHGVADVCIVLAQVIGIVMHSHLPELPNSLLERRLIRRRGEFPGREANKPQDSTRKCAVSSSLS